MSRKFVTGSVREERFGRLENPNSGLTQALNCKDFFTPDTPLTHVAETMAAAAALQRHRRPATPD